MEAKHSKQKPKVRVVHIFAPKIIKTEPAQFRELVQRLTGKPNKRSIGKKKTRPIILIDNGGVSECSRSEKERLKGDEMRVESYGQEFLGGMGDVEGFFQGFNELPLLPLSSSLMGGGFWEAHAY